MAPAGFFTRLLGAIRNIANIMKTPRAQRVSWIVAVMIFFGGFAAAVASQPSLFSNLDMKMMAMVVIALCPPMVVANALTAKETARLAGARLTYAAAFKLSVMSTAANHLPAPGGPILRIAAMQSSGATLKDAGLANLAAGFAWIGVTFLLAAICANSISGAIAAIFFPPAGLFLAGAGLIGVRLPGGVASIARIFLLGAAAALLYAVAVYSVLSSFGASWSFAQAAVVSAAGVIGAAASITPSGLGVREAASAGIAAAIGAAPAAAFAATAVVHIAMTAIMGVCALVIVAARRKEAAA